MWQGWCGNFVHLFLDRLALISFCMIKSGRSKKLVTVLLLLLYLFCRLLKEKGLIALFRWPYILFLFQHTVIVVESKEWIQRQYLMKQKRTKTTLSDIWRFACEFTLHLTCIRATLQVSAINYATHSRYGTINYVYYYTVERVADLLEINVAATEKKQRLSFNCSNALRMKAI